MRLFPVVPLLLLTATLSAQSVRVTFVPPPAIEPDQPVTWRLTIENVSGAQLPAAPLSLSIHWARVGSVQGLDCAPETFSLRCTLPSLAAGQTLAIEASVQYSFRHGRTGVDVSVRFGENLPERFQLRKTYWREFPVTTTADSGPGSLRQAILDINAEPECRNADGGRAPCSAAFRITEPVPAEGWYTVRPETPLPALTGYDCAIDGSTQTAANALGPAVALDGSALVFGNGITVDTTPLAEIRGLAIGGFPWDGIRGTERAWLTVEDCYIGVDPTGRRAHPNGSRGIASNHVFGTIARNVIGGNGRSGIFFMGQPSIGPNILDNRIGVGAHDDTPIGNGASGIFIADFWAAYNNPTIAGNVIANNAHFGVALTANAPMLVLANTIRDNGEGGIDIGLDGPTDSVPGLPGVHGGVVPPPVILSARYADGVTTITGYSLAGTNRRQVLLYANSKLERGDFAEGEQFLGITPVQYREDTAFTFRYPGDLRGKYINGTSSAVTQWGFDEYLYTSSEFGRAVAVE